MIGLPSGRGDRPRPSGRAVFAELIDILPRRAFETLPFLQAAQPSQRRWQIDHFFQWTGRQLRIKRFFGTSISVMKTQVCIAISICVLAAILVKEFSICWRLSDILQRSSATPFERIPSQQVFSLLAVQDPTDDPCNHWPLLVCSLVAPTLETQSGGVR